MLEALGVMNEPMGMSRVCSLRQIGVEEDAQDVNSFPMVSHNKYVVLLAGLPLFPRGRRKQWPPDSCPCEVTAPCLHAQVSQPSIHRQEKRHGSTQGCCKAPGRVWMGSPGGMGLILEQE